MHSYNTRHITFNTPKDLADYIDTHDVKSVAMPFKFYLKFRREYEIVMRYGQPTYNGVILNIEVGFTESMTVNLK